MIIADHNSHNDTLTLVMQEDLLSTNAERALHEIETAIENSPRYHILWLNLTACKMIDSVGLNLIFALLGNAKDKGIEACLMISKGPLERIVRAAQLNRMFKVQVRA